MKDCPIRDRQVCKFLGSEGCDNCVITALGKKMDPADFADNWDITLGLLPDDIDELHTTEECKFCKGTPGKKVGFEELSMKHREPVYKKGVFFGFGTKVEGDVGSLVDIPITVCKSCKRKIMLDKSIVYMGSVIGMIIGLVIVLMPGVEEKLAAAFWGLPIMTIAAATIAGYVASKIMKNSLRKSAEERMHIDPLEISQISKMTLLGWKPMQSNKKGEAVLNFKKRKAREHMMYKTQVRPEKFEN